MNRHSGRPKGASDGYWPDRMVELLSAISSIQAKQHTVSLRELEAACGVSRQTIADWLRIAERRGYVNRHGGQPRGLELLPLGRAVLVTVKESRRRPEKSLARC